MRLPILGFLPLFYLCLSGPVFACTASLGAPIHAKPQIEKCNQDEHCPEKQFCFLRTGSCTACVNCDKYQRLPGVIKCAKEQNQCGPCKFGYEELTVSRSHCQEKSSLEIDLEFIIGRNKSSADSGNEMSVSGLTVWTILLVAAAVVTPVCMAFAAFQLKKWPFNSSEGTGTPDQMEMRENRKDQTVLLRSETVQASAPIEPEEYRPPPPYHDVVFNPRQAVVLREPETTVVHNVIQRALPNREGNAKGNWIYLDEQNVPEALTTIDIDVDDAPADNTDAPIFPNCPPVAGTATNTTPANVSEEENEDQEMDMYSVSDASFNLNTHPIASSSPRADQVEAADGPGDVLELVVEFEFFANLYPITQIHSESSVSIGDSAIWLSQTQANSVLTTPTSSPSVMSLTDSGNGTEEEVSGSRMLPDEILTVLGSLPHEDEFFNEEGEEGEEV